MRKSHMCQTYSLKLILNSHVQRFVGRSLMLAWLSRTPNWEAWTRPKEVTGCFSRELEFYRTLLRRKMIILSKPEDRYGCTQVVHRETGPGESKHWNKQLPVWMFA